MAFGLSGANGRAQMSQADVVVAFYDTTTRVFRAEDYFLSDLSQCDGQHGACPDERIGGRNDVVVCMLFLYIFAIYKPFILTELQSFALVT